MKSKLNDVNSKKWLFFCGNVCQYVVICSNFGVFLGHFMPTFVV